MIGVDELVKVFSNKLAETGSLDAALTKAVWNAYKAGYAEGSMSQQTGYQWQNDTWLIEGVTYSGAALRYLAKAQGETYRVTRTGETVTLELMPNAAPNVLGERMTTDCELLELAAKAAGIKGAEYHGQIEGMWSDLLDDYWNPLTDDGDALRLAVKLNMGISIPVFKKPRADVITFRNSLVNVIEEGNDPYAATRRAIVRAAAEIGRSMG